MIPLNSKKQGFALLMALIVVSVVISIGLSVLELTLKQVRLSTNSKDSEIVFHATNAGLECARYWLNKEATTSIEIGANISPTCFGVSSNPSTVSKTSPVATGGVAYKYEMDFTWGSAPTERCSKMTILTLVSTPSATTTVNGMSGVSGVIPGYPGTEKKCGPSGRCSVISIQGFNRACSMIDSPGTLQREVLLQL